MFHQASSSQSSSAFNGSGALSHVYVQYPPLRCSIPGARGLFYDDGNKLLISPTSHQVFSWKTSPYTSLAASTVDPISEGPILSIRYSLDAKVLGIQRSNHEIQFWHRETGNTFSQRCKSDSESILGFFWTDAPACDVVFVKTSGLDLFSLGAESNSLNLVDTKRFSVSWYMYTHESRLVLFASGMQCKSFTGYQLSSAGIIRLPRFEMAIAKSEANSKPVLAAEDVHIVTVYGRIYCFQVDRVAMLLHSYRFYRDAVVQQGSLPIYSSRVALSVVDNVLLIHQVEAKVVILYDIFSDSRAPISAPLPLLIRGDPRSTTSSSQASSRDAGSSDGKELSDTEATLYRDSWTFLIPDMVCDAANGLLWKIHLDLEAISASSSEVPSVLEFLQRRKLKAYKAKELCLAMVRTIILERRPVSMVSRAIDILVTSYSHSVKTGTYSKGIKAERTSSSSVPQAESPGINADNSTHRVDSYGKSIRHESAIEVQGEQPVKRPSNFSASDSEDNTGIEPQKPIAGGLSSSASTTENESALQSEVGGPGFRSLNATLPSHEEPQITSAAISPDEMYSSVFAVVEDEMAGDSSYLVSTVVEFLRSATLEKIKVDPSIYVLAVQLLARSERHAELGLFIINKIIEPSKEVAMQLLNSGRQNIQIRKLGLDMLRQLSLHHDYVLLLVEDGYYLEALRYARKNKVSTVRPSLFLEAAYASNDSQHVAAVLRFFCDFIPGFKSTPDYRSYSRIVAEVNSMVTA